MRRRDFIAGCLGLPLIAAADEALAETGPLTKIIFPFAAGGGGDTLCRLLAQQIGQALDRTVIVENRTGGDGLIGIKAVKSAKADGATILVTTGPTMYLLPMVETVPSFDTGKDFVPVSLLARFEFGVVVGPTMEATDFKRFLAAQGSPGPGDLRGAEQWHDSAFHRLKAAGRSGHVDDPRALSRQRADHQ
jgi:tripartite-type tricarboxylate transporter receptor subunit TctC